MLSRSHRATAQTVRPGQGRSPKEVNKGAPDMAAFGCSAGQPSIYFTGLAGALGVSVSAVSQIVPTLEKGKLVTVTRAGNAKLITANTQAPFYRPLRELLEIVAGPPSVLAEEFAGIAGIRDLFIFGSWASRALGVPGRQPNDLDVLLVGDPEWMDVSEAALAAESRLGREVNPLVRSAADWDSQEDAFLRGLAAEPMICVTLPAAPDRPPVARTSYEGLPDRWWDALLRDEDSHP